MYYIAKFLEFTGLTILGINVYLSFPYRISYEILVISIAFFTVGFLIEKFVLKQ